jgi:para-nitrobenzyl esterase
MSRRFSLLVLLALGACGDSSSESEPDAAPPPELVFTTPPVADLPAGVKFAGAVPYGTDPMQVIDVFLPESATPTAAVLYIHGGGFTQGSRTDVYGGAANALHQVLEANVAWIGVEYRLLQAVGTETQGVRKSLDDSQRALQFVRYHAATFNIDPERIGLHGTSAGAGTCLWLAYHDDLAEPGSQDVIARQSTRPRAVGVLATQSTYDVMRWAPDIFHDSYSYVTNDTLLTQENLRALLVQFYGLDAALVDDPEALEAALGTTAMAAYRADVDMLALMSSDDPPVYFRNDALDRGPLEAGFDLLHHPLHAQALLTRATQVSATAEADIPAFEITSTHEAIDFLLEHLAP